MSKRHSAGYLSRVRTAFSRAAVHCGVFLARTIQSFGALEDEQAAALIAAQSAWPKAEAWLARERMVKDVEQFLAREAVTGS